MLKTPTMDIDTAKRLISSSRRSDIPSFMVMDVVAAAARLEAAGTHVVHMEIGQPAAPAPKAPLTKPTKPANPKAPASQGDEQ